MRRLPFQDGKTYHLFWQSFDSTPEYLARCEGQELIYFVSARWDRGNSPIRARIAETGFGEKYWLMREVPEEEFLLARLLGRWEP